MNIIKLCIIMLAISLNWSAMQAGTLILRSDDDGTEECLEITTENSTIGSSTTSPSFIRRQLVITIVNPSSGNNSIFPLQVKAKNRKRKIIAESEELNISDFTQASASTELISVETYVDIDLKALEAIAAFNCRIPNSAQTRFEFTVGIYSNGTELSGNSSIFNHQELLIGSNNYSFEIVFCCLNIESEIRDIQFENEHSNSSVLNQSLDVSLIQDKSGSSDHLSKERHDSTLRNRASQEILAQIFPNPVSDQAYLRLANLTSTSLTLKVYSSFGRLVYQKTYKSNIDEIKFTTTDWTPGLYQVVINTSQAKLAIKLLVQR